MENDAFDRYMNNIGLLEEVFSLKSFLKGSTEDGLLASKNDHASAEDGMEKMVSEQKLKLRSNPIRSENVRKRIQQIIDGGLKKLQKLGFNDGPNNPTDPVKGPDKEKSWQVERASALSDLIDKLNKARNEDDIKSCLVMKAQLYSQHTRFSQTETKVVDVLKEQTAKNDLASRKEFDCFSQKLFRTVEIDEEALTSIDAHFSSLEKIEDL